VGKHYSVHPFQSFPQIMTNNKGLTTTTMLRKLADLDRQGIKFSFQVQTKAYNSSSRSLYILALLRRQLKIRFRPCHHICRRSTTYRIARRVVKVKECVTSMIIPPRSIRHLRKPCLNGHGRRRACPHEQMCVRHVSAGRDLALLLLHDIVCWVGPQD
jgi:hypothetical protein